MIRKKSYLFSFIVAVVFMLGVLSPWCVNSAAAAFSDVNNDNPNQAYVNYVSQLGLMTGYPDGGFHPNDPLSRAQAAVIISKAAKLNVNPNTASGFWDVPAKHWAASYIGTAVHAGYLSGMSDGSFRPNDNLNRAQGISLLLRLSKQADTGVALPSLNDVDDKYWAARSIATGLAAEMIDLPTPENFNPEAPITRGELSKALAILLTTDPGLSAKSLTGSLVSLDGEVAIIHSGNKKILPLGNSSSVVPGDTVQTGSNGSARVDFPDGSSIMIEDSSELLIKNMQGQAYIKKSGAAGIGIDYLEIELHKGQIFGGLASLRKSSQEEEVALNSGLYNRLACSDHRYDLLAAASETTPWYKTAQKKKVKVVVDMPWGVSAIRGSFWSNIVSDTQSDMTLLEGSGEISVGNQVRSLQPGQSSHVTGAGAAPTVGTSMTIQEQHDWYRNQDWVTNTATQMSYNQEYGLQGNLDTNLQQMLNDCIDSLNSGAGGGGGGCGS